MKELEDYKIRSLMNLVDIVKSAEKINDIERLAIYSDVFFDVLEHYKSLGYNIKPYEKLWEWTSNRKE